MNPDSNRLNANGESPRCPRCGYDQTGVTGWRTQCPLEGKCSECGLDFLWRDVLHPRFSVPTWCVEYGSAGTFPIRIVRTMLMMLRPWRFWRELKMHHAPRSWRIALMLLLVISVSAYFAFAFSVGMGTWNAANYSATIAARTSPPWLDGFRAGAMPFWFSTNTMYGAMPGKALSDFELARIPVDGWLAIRFGIDPLPWGDQEDLIAERAFTLLCTLLLCPLGFALLPASRRIAKVRWSHVQRIAMYSLLIAVPIIAIDFYDQFSNIKHDWRGEISLGIMLGGAAILASWWAMASRHYLRMPHAWLVGVHVVLFGYLVQYLIFQCVDLAIQLLK